MSKVLVLNGPNLNLLGTREPEVYGRDTLDDVNRRLIQQGAAAGITIETFQNNSEGALIDRIQSARTDGTSFAIINAGALTHTSLALRDAFAAVALPFIEVHISNLHARESFRHHSYLSATAAGVIVGLGTDGYRLALDHIIKRLKG
jgi:3-dehydroquinate dehydratase II